MNIADESFPGLSAHSLAILESVTEKLLTGFASLPDINSEVESEKLKTILSKTAEKLQENYPYHHPFYLGQMMKPPHPIAQMAYTLAMSINPNNHALDGGIASSAMEKEAIQKLAEMFGWSSALGHLCGGGTIANLEALWVSREFTAGKTVAVSSQAHYTHSRCCSLLGLDCRIINCDRNGRIDLDELKQKLDSEEIGTVVVTLGTTALGAVDPLEDVLNLQRQYGFRIHVDSAYGGYFRLAEKLSAYAARQYELISQVDSIVIDPHKHGLQPYGCGCVLFRDLASARVYKHDSPYTYFSSDELHLGEISLECSRAGAAAVALWSTLQLFPLNQGEVFAKRLDDSLTAAQQLYYWLVDSGRYQPVVEPELDIVVWAVQANSATESSAFARQVFQHAAERNLHFALVTLPCSLVQKSSSIEEWDHHEVTCLRACLMKPEHLEWMPKILKELQQVTDLVINE